MASNAAVGSATGNYTITYEAGKLTIKPAELTITVKDQKYAYNGSPQGEDNATYTEGFDQKVEVAGLKGSDELTSITLNGQKTSAGEYDEAIEASAAEVGDSTDNYSVRYVPGKLTITKAELAIAVKSQEYTYNGSPQGESGATYTKDLNKKVDVSGLQGSDVLSSITLDGQKTDAGVYENTIVPSTAELDRTAAPGLRGAERAGTIADNYNIEYAAGRLTIDPAEVVVTITGHHKTVKYDETEHAVKGYDVAFSDPIYKESDFTFTPAATATLIDGKIAAVRTEVGRTDMGLAPDQFENHNSNFGKVTFKVIDGFIEVTKSAPDPTDPTKHSKSDAGGNGTRTGDDWNPLMALVAAMAAAAALMIIMRDVRSRRQ